MNRSIARHDAPRITVVTPSYNQARFLEACLSSILDQQYPNLEYIVIDGGSTDGSVEIIKKFEKHLAYWISEPDAGHYDAVNKGFRRATGEILAWLNSDDMYAPWCLSVIAEIFTELSEIEWITTLYPLSWNASGLPFACREVLGFTPTDVLRWRVIVQQESTFWRRALWERCGELDTSFALAADLELWARFWRHADLYGVPVPLAGFRHHGDQRSVRLRAQYLAEVEVIRQRYADLVSTRARAVFEATHRVLPRRLRRGLSRLGVPYRVGTAKVIRRPHDRWCIDEIYTQ